MASIGQQNLKTVVTLGGSVDSSFTKIGSTFKKSMGTANKTVKDLTRQQKQLTSQIRRSKLAGADVSLLTMRYETLSEEIKRASDRAEGFAKIKTVGNWLKRTAKWGSAAAGAVFGTTLALGGMVTTTNNATSAMAGLAHSQSMTVEQFQQWNGIAKQADLSGENIGDMIEELTNKYGEFTALGSQSSVSDVFGALGITQSMMTGMNAAQQFEFVMKRLQKVQDSQQAASLADMLMGGESNKVVTYIRSTGKSLDDLLKTQQRFNMLTNQGASGAVKFNHSFQNLTSVIHSGWQEISGILGNEFAGQIDSLAERIRTYVTNNKINIVDTIESMATAVYSAGNAIYSFGKNVQSVVNTMGGWQVIGEAIAALIGAKMIVGIGGFVGTLVTLGKSVRAASGAMGIFNAVMDANPVGLIVIAIAGLIMAGIELYKHWDDITKWFRQALDAMHQKFSQVFDGIKQSAQAFWSGITSVFHAAWGGIKSFFSGMWSGIKSMFSTAWDGVKTAFSWTPLGMVIKHWEPIQKFFTGLWDGIKAKFINGIKTVRQIMSTVSGWVSKLKFWGNDDSDKPKNETEQPEDPTTQSNSSNTSPRILASARMRNAVAGAASTTTTNHVNQYVGGITVTAAPGQTPAEVAQAVQVQLTTHRDSALHDHPEG